MTLVMRAAADSSRILSSIRVNVATLDPSLPTTELVPLSRAVSDQLAPSKFRTILLAGFGGAALLLAGIGVYGLISYAVAQRTSEIGIRLALGASRAQVRRLVMRHAVTLAAAGLGAGLAVALLVSRSLSSLLFDVRPADPATLAAVVALLFAVALAASYLPARRAMGIDPATALRSE
jgi:putative ABC transport system permease protein